MKILSAAFLVALLSGTLAQADSPFETRAVEGWAIHLDNAIRTKDPALESQVIHELQLRLEEMRQLLPPKRVEELRRVAFYVHLDAAPGHSGYITRPAPSDNNTDVSPGSIDLGSAAQFLESQREVPSRVLHELAHSYHFQVLGADDPDVRAAYDSALRANRYTHVRNWQGKVVDRSYALTDVFEYFALATQAYFERSGFYPFDRTELQAYDPMGFELMQAVWQNRPGPQPANILPLGRVGHACAQVTSAEPREMLARSLPSILAIRNDSQTTVEAWWLSGQGGEKKYAEIPPQGLFLQRVYNPHVWQIRDTRNGCLVALDVGPLGIHVTLEP
jgi:hypothetical protein